MLTQSAASLATGVKNISSVDETSKNWLPWQRPSRDQKTIFRLIIYSHSSTNPENLAKIGRVDFQITGPTGIVKE